MRQIGHYIDGENIAGASSRSADIFNPNTGQVQAKVNLAGTKDIEAAIASADAAQQEWLKINPQRRARIMFALSLIHISEPTRPY